MMQDLDDTELDRLLARAEAPTASPALTRRILADFDRIVAKPSLAGWWRRAAEAVLPGAPAWQPAFALAMALLIGVGAAVLAPLELSGNDDGPAFALGLDAQDF